MPHRDTMNWLDVHLRLSQGDIAAGNRIVQYFLPWVSQRLCRHRPDVDMDLAAESTENALLDYLSNPRRFDVTRGVFLGYWLWLQARGHLSRLLRRERSRQAHEQAVGVTDKNFENSLSKVSLEMAIYRGRKREETGEQLQALHNLLPRLSLYERMEVELLRCGTRFEEWVDYLGIAHLPLIDQRRKVNAEKARLKKKIRRLAQKVSACCDE